MDEIIAFAPCEWREISGHAARYIAENGITVDSYWEGHVLESRHYKMTCGGELAGFFAVHGESVITLFYVCGAFAAQSQQLFARVKKYESVTCALVATGDEFFLSHCADDFIRMEKQAYLATYAENNCEVESFDDIKLRLADLSADRDEIKLCGDFWDEELEKHARGLPHADIYIAGVDGETVGFGVIEYGKIVEVNASIGMFVLEKHRRQGYAAGILRALCRAARANGAQRVLSGCRYYNHNSKKSIEKAGGRCKTRLLRFYF